VGPRDPAKTRRNAYGYTDILTIRKRAKDAPRVYQEERRERVHSTLKIASTIFSIIRSKEGRKTTDIR
jgi:hypothetical protein